MGDWGVGLCMSTKKKKKKIKKGDFDDLNRSFSFRNAKKKMPLQSNQSTLKVKAIGERAVPSLGRALLHLR